MTNLNCRKGRSRGLPALLLMAVIIVLGLAMAFVTTQSAYADDNYDVAFVMVDQSGDELENQNNNSLYKGGKKYIRIDLAGLDGGDSFTEPYLCFYANDEEIQCKKTDGWSYDPSTQILELDGTGLWNKGKQLGTSELMIHCIIQKDIVDTVNAGGIQIELSEGVVEVKNNLCDEELYPGTSANYNKDEFEVEVFNATYPDGETFAATLTDLVVLSEEPREPGNDVVNIRDLNELIELEAESEGTAVIKATLTYDNGKEITKEYTIKVVGSMYVVRITAKDNMTEALPGETIELEANVTRETAYGSEELDDVDYEWSLSDDYEASDIDRFFTIDPNDNGDKATVTLKSKAEIIEAFEEAGEEYDINELFEKEANAGVTIKKAGEEVAGDYIKIQMHDQFYRIGTPEAESEFDFAKVNDRIKIDLTLWNIYSDGSGRRIEEKVPIADVVYMLNDEAYDTEVGFAWTEGNSEGTLISLEENDASAMVEAYLKDTDYPDDRRYVTSKSFSLNYVPRDLGMYEISTRKNYYPVTEEDGTVSLKELGIYVYRDGSILDPSVYEIVIERVFIDPGTDDETYEPAEPPLGIHNNDRKDNVSEYSISIYPKEGSGFTGEIEREFSICVWYKYMLTADHNTILRIDQEELPWEELGEDYPPYDDIWFMYNHQRFETGIKEKPVLELRDESKLKRDDYELRYYKRDPGVGDPENSITDEDLLPAFPTEAGTYLAVAEGKAPYKGKAYLAFDLTESLKGAIVTGISDKAYTGKRLRQDMKKVNVTLNGKKLVDGVDFEVSYDNNIKTGKNVAKIYIAGINKYGGTITRSFTINKAANPLKIKAKTVTVKGSSKGKKGKLKKNKTVSCVKVIAFTKKGQGKMTYTKVSGNKKITINKTTGKVTVKKGLKKGTYKVKVKVKAAGNANYKPSAWNAVTFKVKVK